MSPIVASASASDEPAQVHNVATATPPKAGRSVSMAERQAQREGLKLARCSNSCGFAGVRFKEREQRPYKAWHRDGSGQIWHLGYHCSAEEAALAVARKVAELVAGAGPVPTPSKARPPQPIAAAKESKGAATNKSGAARANADGLTAAASTSKKRRRSATDGAASMAAAPAQAQSQPEEARRDEAMRTAIRKIRGSEPTLTAKQVHALLPGTGVEATLSAVKRLCSELARDGRGNV